MKFCIALFVNIIFLVLVSPLRVHAQPIIFNSVSPPEGTSWGQGISGITQDKHGYMWFAGPVGLHRYDGYHLISYLHDPLDPASLAGNVLRCIFTDGNRYIWVGTYEDGLDRFDPVTGTFIHFRHRTDDATSLSSNSVRMILRDHAGTIWVGTDAGLDCLNEKTGKFTHYKYDPNDPSSLSNGRVTALFVDRQGTMWVGTERGLSNAGPIYGGLNRMNRETGKFTRYQHDPKNENSLADDRITAIFEDSRGTLWVGTSGNVLHSMDKEKGTFEKYLYDPGKPGVPGKALPPGQDLQYEFVTFITEDASGAIWFGTYRHGINRYDPRTQIMAHFESDNLQGFTDKSGWRAYTSREGVLWISTTEGGLFRTDPLRKNVPYYDTHFPVTSIYETTPGEIWIGTMSWGLVQANQHKEVVKRYVNEPLNPKSISSNLVESIYEDRQGTLWIGTQEGLDRFNRADQTFTRYKNDPANSASLTRGPVRVVYEDRKGSLWTGTDGLDQMNRQTGTFTHYSISPKDVNAPGDSVECIIDDRLGNLWVGTHWGGINSLNVHAGKFKKYLDKARVSAILEDAGGIIWAGTASGLYRFNRDTDSFSLFTEPGAGLSATVSVYSLFEDAQKNIWAGTSLAIFRLNSDRSQISRYGRNIGIDIRKLMGVAFKGPGGEFFFGDQSGYYAFHPEDLIRKSISPQVVLTEFRLANQVIRPGRNSPLSMPIELTDQIRLSYKQDAFSFDYAGIHFSNPEDNRHLFMLENLDNTWRKAGAEKTAYYNNVPPGKYIFRVRSASNDGVWAEKAVTIIIDPPWWRTVWAYIVYVLLITGVIWSIVYNRSRNLRRKNFSLEEKVTQRTVELKQQKEELQNTLEELKATQTHLIQREKMASLGELTAGIAHEIQNPLNFVNNFSEVNAELIDEINQALQAGNTANAVALAGDIKENNAKITHHGKRADAIVKGMLQHSRTSTGKKELTDINALTDEYLRLGYHGLRVKNNSLQVTIETRYDKALPLINLIPQDVGRVLLNLFTNAFYSVIAKKKLHPDGYDPQVLVTTQRSGDHVEIRIRDNGTGISSKIAGKIFQPFFTTKPTGHGTGLGLSLSYDIIKAHRGDLKMETTENEFAEFIIQLPIGHLL